MEPARSAQTTQSSNYKTEAKVRHAVLIQQTPQSFRPAPIEYFGREKKSLEPATRRITVCGVSQLYLQATPLIPRRRYEVPRSPDTFCCATTARHCGTQELTLSLAPAETAKARAASLRLELSSVGHTQTDWWRRPFLPWLLYSPEHH